MIKKLERMGAAIAFAEAGEFDTARQILAEVETTFSGSRRKILLVANDEPVKTGMIEYALSLASRIQSDTVILNVFSAAQSASRIKKCSAIFSQLWQDISGNTKPEGKHGYFAVRGEAQKLVTDVCHRIGRVEMVIVQAQRKACCNYKLPVPVFCFD